ncbi:MAG: helix-turn-helix domain-containing protein [Actinophytocola sp.]|uniref:helix-turn-helix domain-containing protein n=1 Tax=Actinophytocola sp. TaxID=1872138 RepID=UPI001325DFCB|nr:helix-turn-helix transcriptional regulator [Actinophytocola sp.]MPZ82136.1 helix-turn-helix domain-containing protein [Actinophytocola sp.]
MDTTTRVGARVANLRKRRGLTQAALAVRAFYSLDTVKKVEQGRIPPSAAFVGRVARALDVDPSHLYGVEDRSMAEESSAVQLANLRAAVDAWDDPRPEGPLLSLDAINRRLDAIARQVAGTKYADAAGELSPLLHHLYVLADRAGSDGEVARAALHDAYRLTATVAGRFRQADIAAVASERHIQLAPSTGDPLRVAISAFHRSSRYLGLGDYSGGLRVLERVQAHLAKPSAVATQVHLRNAVLSARAGRLDRADEYVVEARAMRRDGQADYRGIDASALNVDVHWCALPVEALDGTEAVRRGAEVQLAGTGKPERLGHHHIDQARAWLLHGDRRRCLDELNEARRVAPFNTRHHPSVHETIIALASADRRKTESLAGFAKWAGVAV